jgi:hypothetical protein
MRLLQNKQLQAAVTGDLERSLAAVILAPRLRALVEERLVPGTPPLASFDVGSYLEDQSSADAVLLQGIKAVLVLAARLEPSGAHRVLLRRDGPSGPVTVRCFPRDDSHPRSPDDVDVGVHVQLLFADTRRIDGARR